MNPAARCAVLFLIALAAAGCRPENDVSEADAAEIAARQKRLTARMASAQGDSAVPLARWILPEDLREISGIALLPDGRLLAHNDERSRVYVIDPRVGKVMKTFAVGGAAGIVADFEAITTSGSDIYMLVSDGTIYRFREGADGASVPFTTIDTRLGKECEFEGIAVDDSASFILPCKTIDDKNLRNQIMIYRWRAVGGGEPIVSTITIPLADAVGSNDWKKLSPSDVAIDPSTGNYVMITGPEKAMIEVTRNGDFVQSRPLPGKPQQPEGIAISRQGIMILSDEAVTREADITLYRWPLAGTPARDTARATTTAGDYL